MSKVVLFALVAIGLGDRPNTQTISYHATIAECHVARNRLEPTANKSYVKLDCIPIKVE
jgi:hypothetical protein